MYEMTKLQQLQAETIAASLAVLLDEAKLLERLEDPVHITLEQTGERRNLRESKGGAAMEGPEHLTSLFNGRSRLHFTTDHIACSAGLERGEFKLIELRYRGLSPKDEPSAQNMTPLLCRVKSSESPPRRAIC